MIPFHEVLSGIAQREVHSVNRDLPTHGITEIVIRDAVRSRIHSQPKMAILLVWRQAFFSITGMARNMNSSKRGTVNAMSPWAGL
jgi:hypothetical protein